MYDEWVNVTATIERSDIEKTPYNNRDGSVSYSYQAGDIVVWVVGGTKHYADSMSKKEAHCFSS